jgi:hypothetical protein
MASHINLQILTVGKVNLIRYWVKRATRETSHPFTLLPIFAHKEHRTPGHRAMRLRTLSTRIN